MFDKERKPALPLLENSAGGTRGHWLLSVNNIQRLRSKIGGTSSFIQSIFDAWDTNGDGVLSREEIKTGLSQLMRSSDIPVRFIAAKIMEEVDMDTIAVVNPDEFHEFAARVTRKFMLDIANGAVVKKDQMKETAV
jgi:hypothetical protein